MASKRPRKTKTKPPPATEVYEHKEATVLLRPDVGTQAQFKKEKPRQRYRYDSSLSPALEWDGQNPAREQGEVLIAEILKQTASATAAASRMTSDAKPIEPDGNWRTKHASRRRSHDDRARNDGRGA
jgi:adenine-specific DNA-methyltransferase